jgi:hypothetical protein
MMRACTPKSSLRVTGATVLVAVQLAQAENVLGHLGRADTLEDHRLLDDVGEL